MNPAKFSELIDREMPSWPEPSSEMRSLDKEVMMAKLEEVWPTQWEIIVAYVLEQILGSLGGKREWSNRQTITWHVRTTGYLYGRTYSNNKMLRSVRRNLEKGYMAFVGWCTSTQLCNRERALAALVIYMRHVHEEATGT